MLEKDPEQSDVMVASGLIKTFGKGHTQVTAVDDISLTLKAGEIALIMGPSGSGKTTLLSMLGGLLTPSAGSIEIEGQNISHLNAKQLPAIRALKIGFIFQAFNLLDALTVEENILFPARLDAAGKSSIKQRSDQLIVELGLQKRRHALPKTLSGGEKQRVAIARALINNPRMILADEPTGNLDSTSGQEVMMLLHDIARDQGVAVLLVTHDPRVEEIADRILWLEDGRLFDRKSETHAWTVDPVCRMKVDQWTATEKVTYQNAEYFFCSASCKTRFEQSPEKYLSDPPAESRNGQGE